MKQKLLDELKKADKAYEKASNDIHQFLKANNYHPETIGELLRQSQAGDFKPLEDVLDKL